MRIAIDCRYLGKSGIGRVLEGFLDNLDFSSNQYYLIGDKNKLEKYKPYYIYNDLSEPYSKKGIMTNYSFINKNCDCIFIPNFLIPFSLRLPVYSIIHDLIFLDLKEITTNGFIDYQIKKALLNRCVKKSKHVFCVSSFTKSRCEHYYPKYKGKFETNYISVGKPITSFDASSISKKNQIVYVGNIKPHKGILDLLSVYEKLGSDKPILKVIGNREKFITGLNINESKYKDVSFTGEITNSRLYEEIASSKYLVLPSKYEGFGLPPLEALYLGTEPIISSIDIFKEIYSSLPVKFYSSLEELGQKIMEDPDQIDPFIKDKILDKYSFAKFTSIIINYIEKDFEGKKKKGM